MTRSDEPDRTGEVVGGRYRVEGMIGEGGQSAVYLATDLESRDEVALKVMKPEFADDPKWRARMHREAGAMEVLKGTAAVRVIDQQTTDDGALCLVTEYLRGVELEEWLYRVESPGGRATVDHVIAILDPIVDTLELAHEHQIVHRDLKPGNIFMVERKHGGGVRLLDFGFAKFLQLRGLTTAGMIAGSPKYIAPEAWKGETGLDHRIDVYSLGVVVFRCLAGEVPFDAKEMVLLLKMVTSDPRPSLHARRPDLPRAIDEWVEQAMAIDREERFQHVRGMWNAFREIARTRAAATTP